MLVFEAGFARTRFPQVQLVRAGGFVSEAVRDTGAERRRSRFLRLTQTGSATRQRIRVSPASAARTCGATSSTASVARGSKDTQGVLLSRQAPQAHEEEAPPSRCCSQGHQGRARLVGLPGTDTFGEAGGAASSTLLATRRRERRVSQDSSS